MATRIRLRRMGAKKRPFYRVVVADQRSPRDGRFIEAIGKYHPLEDPSLIDIDEERALDWLRKGAQPSEAVTNLLEVSGIWEKFLAERPGAARVEAKAGARTQAKRDQAKAAARATTEAAAPPADAAPSPKAQPEEAPGAAEATPDEDPAEERPVEASGEASEEVSDES